MAAQGPYAAQIQMAINGLLAGDNTWTGTNTFSGGVSIGSLTSVGSITFTGGQALSGATANRTMLSNGASAQTLEVYGVTGANASWIELKHDGTNGVIKVNRSGSGGYSNIYFNLAGADRFVMNTSTGYFGTVTGFSLGHSGNRWGGVFSTTGDFNSTVTTTALKTSTALVTATDGSGTAAFTANMVASTGGPTTTAQNGWVKMQDSAGATVWVPVWK